MLLLEQAYHIQVVRGIHLCIVTQPVLGNDFGTNNKIVIIIQKNNFQRIKIGSEVLAELTGRSANLLYDYTVTYSNQSFDNDVKVWNEWYENNKCKMKEVDFDKVKDKAKLEIK